jgi:hypothetical protein
MRQMFVIKELDKFVFSNIIDLKMKTIIISIYNVLIFTGKNTYADRLANLRHTIMDIRWIAYLNPLYGNVLKTIVVCLILH